jgi:ATP-dependent helicase HrpB
MNHDLPIHALTSQLNETWHAQPNLVLVAPTGSGKTTQLPQLLHASGVCAGQRIVVLQPRRVAARSVAARVALEMGSPVGGLVGYQVRFDDKLSAQTEIAFVTDGMLLRWLERDASLTGVGAVVFDEFHERNLLSDTALAICRHLQSTTRPDLRLLVMSATLDAGPVSRFLAAPMLHSDGRSFPVTILHADWDDDRPVWERAAERVITTLRETHAGDVLVFMPGVFEIDRTLDMIRSAWRGEPVMLLPLHGEMSPSQQDRVFSPGDQRRVIVATNVAETSITIPRITQVIDSGLARVMRFDPESGVNALRLEPISQASADQRAGRAGRVAPGVCHRLWSAKQHTTRPAASTPEVRRAELSAVLLSLYGLQVADLAGSGFLDQPEPDRLAAADALLRALGAVAGDSITETGQKMLRLPVGTRYARMLIEAETAGCVREAALMAALVSGRDLLFRINPRDERDRIVKRNRESLVDRRLNSSDYFLYAASFNHAVNCGFDPKQCGLYGVNARAAREVAMTFEQLTSVCEDAGLTLNEPIRDLRALGEKLAQCHLAGFTDHLAMRTSTGGRDYELADGQRYTLVDESTAGSHTLIVASELREITRRDGPSLRLLGFASMVRPEWVRALNPAGLRETVELVFEPLRKRIVGARTLRLGEVLLGAERITDDAIDRNAAARVLAEACVSRLDQHPRWSNIKLRLAGLTQTQIIDCLAAAWYGCLSWSEALQREI